MTQITNSNFDTLAGAVPPPMGPITRVTDINTDFDFNDNRDAKVLVTSALNVDFLISYNELNTAAIRQAILDRAHSGKGVNGWINDLFDLIDGLNRYRLTLSLPHTDAEAVTFLNALRQFMPLVANPPNIRGAWRSDHLPTIVNTITGTGANRTSTLVTTGSPAYIYVDWGDSNIDVGAGPHSNAYGVDGNYLVKAVAIGRGGVAIDKQQIVVDVP